MKVNKVAEPLVEFKSVSVQRGGTQILSKVDFTMNPGQHWVLLGPNGAGKTTLARLVSARDYPDTGKVTVLGSDTATEESTYISARVGVASQDVRDKLAQSDTVISLVLAAAWGQTTQFTETYEEPDEQRAQDLLAALGVGGLAQRPFGTLSEGEKQRVSLARALMADPEIVILDEPTAGLDLGARETLVGALTEIMADPSMPGLLMITHEIEEIAPGFTHVALLKEGRIVQSGLIDTVLTSENLTEVFGLNLLVTKRDDRWWAHAPSS